MLRRRVAGSGVATVNIVEVLEQHIEGESVKQAGDGLDGQDRQEGQDGREGRNGGKAAGAGKGWTMGRKGWTGGTTS